MLRSLLAAALAGAITTSCGAKSPLIVPDVVHAADAFADNVDVPADTRCVPATEVCNGRDDDCNGLVDDIDQGHDGITDCLAIAVLGNPGRDPSSDFEHWLRTNGPRVDRLLTSSEPRLTAELLAPYNVVILDFLTREYEPAERDALVAWVAAGGGLFSMTGHVFSLISVDRPGSLLEGFGVAYIDGLLDERVRMFSMHPTVEGITQLPFFGAYRVELRTAPAASHGAQIIATVPEGSAGAALEFGRGRVVVWGDEWIEYDSQWRAIPDVNRFWVNSLGWLTRSR